MCSLCGILGGNEHWADAVARPGVFTRNHDRVDRRRERANRLRVSNRILRLFAITISDWQGSQYVLQTHTGKSAIVEDLGHMWPAVEQLLGSQCDPLAISVIERLEAAGDE